MKISRLAIFLITFSIFNLVLIPLMSLYGLQVCPILSHSGFWAGCYYTAFFVSSVSILNMVAVYIVTKRKKVSPIWWYLFIYLASSILALVVNQIVFKIQHVSSASRAPEVLILASCLLALTQTYGLSWVFSGKITPPKHESKNFYQLWRNHMTRVMAPMAFALLILAHFFLRQIEGINTNASQIILTFLCVWLAMTYFFHFLSEKDNFEMTLKHMKQIEEGNTQHLSLTTSTWGLWAHILDQLNNLGKALTERGRLLGNFSQFVAKSVVMESLEKDKLVTSGQIKEVTIIMSDIRGFTSLSEKLHPNEVVFLLNTYFSAMLEIMIEHQIVIDKYIGDGILAYVDSEASSVEQNRAAVRSALGMLERLKAVNETLANKGLPSVKIGLGIYRGPVVMGMIGGESKLQHTIIGDSVNRAARLESLCKELGASVIISREVLVDQEKDLQNLFRTFGLQSIKGISEPVEVFGGF